MIINVTGVTMSDNESEVLMILKNKKEEEKEWSALSILKENWARGQRLCMLGLEWEWQ